MNVHDYRCGQRRQDLTDAEVKRFIEYLRHDRGSQVDGRRR